MKYAIIFDVEGSYEPPHGAITWRGDLIEPPSPGGFMVESIQLDGRELDNIEQLCDAVEKRITRDIEKEHEEIDDE